MPKLKSIFASPFILIKKINKSKIDNFVGGLIMGAIFSLLVNVVTVGLQEMIQKQRALEALENEIVNHMLLSGDVIKQNVEEIKKDSLPNFFHNTRVYSDRVWSNSETLQYIIELDPSVQGDLTSYYLAIIENINKLNEKNESFHSSKLQNCYDVDIKLTVKQLTDCKKWYRNFLQAEIDSAEVVFDHAMLTLKNGFHPTQDRLKSPILRTLMGNKTTNILSSERSQK